MDVRCAVWRLGSGDTVPLLLLHGFGGDLNTWMFNQPAFCEHRRTLALELPGHGLSSKDVGAGDAAFFTDVIEAALRCWSALHVVGHSMGGALAIALAARRPERIATLTLLAPAGLGPEINGGFIDAFMRASRRREAVAALQLLVHDPSLIGRAMVEEFLRYKRLDGVVRCTGNDCACLVPGWAAGGDLVAVVARADHAGAGDLGARRSDHPLRPHRRGRVCTSASAGRGRASAAHGESRRGEPADQGNHRLS